MVERGKLVVFEGIDGSGKTTVHNILKEMLSDDDCFIFSKEPTDGVYGRQVREMLCKCDSCSEELFYTILKDRAEHVDNLINPALERGKIVVLDRYFISNMVYQGRSSFDLNYILVINRTIAPEPDLVVYFDVTVEEALKRLMASRKEFSVFETGEELMRVRDNYESVLGLFNTYRVNAMESIEDVVGKVKHILLGLKGDRDER
jgi:dTMP kinase